MYHQFSKTIAERYGIHAALVMEVIKEEIYENEFHQRCVKRGRVWMRCSQKGFTATLPYLSKNTVRKALVKLLRNGVIGKGEFNDCPFDRTTWYCLTPFGNRVLSEVEESERGIV